MKLPVLACLIALMAAPAARAYTQDDVLRADLLPGWRMEGGNHMAGISLTLAAKWKTYWRSPGDAGIPPAFDWGGSENLASVRVHWPSPSVFHTNGMRSVGYHQAVVLPIEVVPVDPALPVRLRARIDMGVCKDICMPATVELGGELTAPGASDQAIRAALKARPRSAKEAGVRHISCEITPIDDGLRLTARLDMPAAGSDEAVVFETADPRVWVSEPQSRREGGSLVAVAELVGPSGAPFGLDRSGVTVTVLAAGRSVEIRGCPAP